MAHFFPPFFSPSSFISLVNPRLGRLWHLRFSMSPRDAIRAMLPRHSKSQRANTLPGLLDSALRSHKTTSHNGSDERTLAQRPSPFHHPHPTLVSPTGLRQRELRPSPFQSHSILLRFLSRLLSLNFVHIIQTSRPTVERGDGQYRLFSDTARSPARSLGVRSSWKPGKRYTRNFLSVN